jgi:hypothetical protein
VGEHPSLAGWDDDARMIERRVRQEVKTETHHISEINIQGRWFNADLIDELLECDGFFSGIRWHERTWDPEAKRYIIEGDMGELQKRGLARESNRGWYGTDTLRQVVASA